jgi:hypothetical protein
MAINRCEACGRIFDSGQTEFYCSDRCKAYMQRRYSGKVETRDQPPKPAKQATMSVNAARLAWLDASATAGDPSYFEQRDIDMVINAALGRPRERRDLTLHERRNQR